MENETSVAATGSVQRGVRPEVWSDLKTDKNPSVNFWIWIGIAGLAVSMLTGCGTISPKPVQSNQPSFMGTSEADSGIISIAEDHSALITDQVRVRYNRLIDRYGKDQSFPTPLPFDAGVTRESPNWRIDAEHLSDYLQMIQWQRDGR